MPDATSKRCKLASMQAATHPRPQRDKVDVHLVCRQLSLARLALLESLDSRVAKLGLRGGQGGKLLKRQHTEMQARHVPPPPKNITSASCLQE